MTKTGVLLNRLGRVRARSIRNLSVASVAVVLLLGVSSITIAPFQAFGGAVWAKDGVHYISNAQIAERIQSINTPKEATEHARIDTLTPACDTVDGGFCKQSTGAYAHKTLVTSAVAYVPAVPDKKVIIGYCTLCGDGSFSPSCAVGRGACSWHGGVAAYNVERYRTVKGTPEVPAQPAVYSYAPKTYQDSQSYVKPVAPSLVTVVNYKN